MFENPHQLIGPTSMTVPLVILAYVLPTAIGALVLYAVIRGAVRSALEEHYKTVRWYERTGEWAGRRAPRSFDSALADSAIK